MAENPTAQVQEVAPQVPERPNRPQDLKPTDDAYLEPKPQQDSPIYETPADATADQAILDAVKKASSVSTKENRQSFLEGIEHEARDPDFLQKTLKEGGPDFDELFKQDNACEALANYVNDIVNSKLNKEEKTKAIKSVTDNFQFLKEDLRQPEEELKNITEALDKCKKLFAKQDEKTEQSDAKKELANIAKKNVDKFAKKISKKVSENIAVETLKKASIIATVSALAATGGVILAAIVLIAVAAYYVHKHKNKENKKSETDSPEAQEEKEIDRIKQEIKGRLDPKLGEEFDQALQDLQEPQQNKSAPTVQQGQVGQDVGATTQTQEAQGAEPQAQNTDEAPQEQSVSNTAQQEEGQALGFAEASQDVADGILKELETEQKNLEEQQEKLEEKHEDLKATHAKRVQEGRKNDQAQGGRQ